MIGPACLARVVAIIVAPVLTFPLQGDSLPPAPRSINAPVAAATTDTRNDEDLNGIQTLIRGGRYADAESLCRSVLSKVASAEGADSLRAARVLDLLSESLRRGGKVHDAETLAVAERAVAIKERLLGAQDAEVAVSLHNAATALYQRGELTRARPLFERSLAIRERTLPPDDPLIARSVDYLANLLGDMEEDDAARALFERALDIRERTLPPDHLDLAESLNGMANFLYRRGDFDAARPCYERALRIRELHLGPRHPTVGVSLNNLAVLLHAKGDMIGARPLYERCLVIREETLGRDHPLVARTLENLGHLLQGMGDYAAARPLFERALAIHIKSAGPDHPDLAWSLDFLADLYHESGDFASAERYYKRAFELRESGLGPDHADTALSLGRLANLHLSMRDPAAARPLCEHALAIQRKTLGDEHPYVASTLGLLAAVMRETGDLKSSEALYEESLRIRQKALGGQDPEVAMSLYDLALVLAETGRIQSALSATLRSERISRDDLRLTGRAVAERQALRYAAVRTTGLDLALSFAAEGLLTRPELRRDVWDALIRSRALVLEEMTLRRRSLARSRLPEVARQAELARRARARLASLMVRGPEGGSIEDYRARLDTARVQYETAERELARMPGAAPAIGSDDSIGLAQVADRLPPDAALVAFATYRPRDCLSANGTGRSVASARQGRTIPPGIVSPACMNYLALVLAGNPREVQVVALGPASEIEHLVARWRQAAMTGALAEADSPGRSLAGYRTVAESLRVRIWDPIATRLRGSRRVFMVPDGVLNLVNFAALPDGDDRYLLQTGPLIHYLPAERAVASGGRPPRTDNAMLVVGDPAFDADLSGNVPSHSDGGSLAPPAGRIALSGPLASIRFQQLPGTAEEVDQIAGLWMLGPKASIVRLERMNADEASFKQQAVGKRVLHIATHGFFLGADDGVSTGAMRGIGGIASGPGASGGSSDDENPLLLSGLALAGANHRAETGGDDEDGILTAEEIASLDLSGVEWAVLSACDTGVGEIMAGEGVSGLRRAFSIAGAGTVIMSLWSVEDDASRAWMEALYRGRLINRLGTAEAVRQASLTVLRQRVESGESTHPFFWAGFVAAGDWR